MNRLLLLIGMVLAAAFSKFIPHPLNFAPIGAIALFGGAHFHSKRAAFLVPGCALLIGDFITGLHQLMPFVYGCFALNVLLGFWIRRRESTAPIIGAAIIGAVLFFFITNFGVWVMLNTFPKTAAGLLGCYVAGLPFFFNSLLGDLFYSAVLFGGLACAESRFPVLRRAEVIL